MTLTDFLSARIAYDKQVYGGHQHGLQPELATHLLADCEAKRLVVRFLGDLERGEFGDAMTASIAHSVLCRMAEPYTDHPDFDPGWKVAA